MTRREENDALMHISMGLPTLLPHGRDEEIAWCRAVDDGPWHSLSTLDMLTYPSWALTVQLAAAAALTERVRLRTDVAALPGRNAVAFAKELATIDVLSGGRLSVGVGIGGHDADLQALGSSLEQRFQRLDRQVAAMRDVWAQVPPVAGQPPVGPEPVQPGGPPLIAGVGGPKGLARAAKWAAGVSVPDAIYHVDAEAVGAHRARVIDAWAAAGREDTPHLSACTWFALGPHAKDQLRRHVWEFMRVFDTDQARSMADHAQGYGPAALRAAVAAGRDAGLDELFLIPTTSDPRELDRVRDALGI